jgi:hypothetical protein
VGRIPFPEELISAQIWPIFLAANAIMPMARPVFAQDLPWFSTFGGTAWDECASCIQCADGGYALAGYSESWSSADDLWLVKTDEMGKQEWASILGGTGYDEGYSLLQVEDKGYIIVGATDSYGAGGSDAWLVRTDSLGSLLWMKTIGTPDDEMLFEVCPTSDGCFVAVGSSGVFPSDMHLYLVKLDETGSLVWERFYGGGILDCGFSVRETSDGGFIIAGGNGSGSGGSTIDGWLLKTDAGGNYQWDLVLGGSGYDRFNSARQTLDGGYIAAGYSYSSDPNNGDLWLVRTGQDGGLTWDTTIGEANGSESAESIELAPDGGFIIAGFNSSVAWPNADLWLLKTDSSGDIGWDTFFGGDDIDIGSCLVLTQDGCFIVGGKTRSYGAGDFDYLLVKFEPPLGIPGEPAPPTLFGHLTALPNPFESISTITFELAQPGQVRLQIFDSSGRLARTLADGYLEEGTHSESFDGSDLPSGVYLCRLRAEGSSATTRIALIR